MKKTVDQEPKGEWGIKLAITLLVDADACPVKVEIYRVMNCYQLKTFIVANCFFPFSILIVLMIGL
ncbi:hypothetical protein GGR08_000115 [Bartonella fuyuanensis]|uniref:Uncharacterized protein n=1 Tax=Bartonella fuyuanensis TaxID=1460968 RepID=A0A840DS02_9HYPH|nr:hypothetical protein [Bartonella fuyuanensis]